MRFDKKTYDPSLSPSWIREYVRLCRKQIDNVPLSQKEQDLARSVDLVGSAIAGVVEDELFELLLPVSSSLRLAAATAEKEATCSDLVAAAVADGKDYVAVDLGTGEVHLFDIRIGESLVRACPQEGFVFTVERRGSGMITVDDSGEFLMFEDLKRLRLIIDLKSRTICLKEV